MNGKLCFLCCQNFRPELEAAVAAEGWADVSVAAFPARCGHPPLTWDDLSTLLEAGCSQIVIIGRACIHELNNPPADWPPVRMVPMDECFHLVAPAPLVAEAIARDAYLITPGWLDDWRCNLRRMGFAEGDAPGFFHDFARELLLLDTGVVGEASHKLAEFSKVVALPASTLSVGLDYVRLQLARLVAEWRLEEARQQAQERERDHARVLADHKSAMDFLGRLPLLKDEQETIGAIEEMFHMLFAPQELYYVRFDGDKAHCDDMLPPELLKQIQLLHNDWAWTDSNTGFLLRITRADEKLGVIAIDRFAFPEYRNHYLNLALSIAGVAGLAIDNARTFRRIKQAEVALLKSERSLKMAQAMAHLGHWELDVSTGNIQWSDETCRILGYDPETVSQSYDTFFQAIHPDDRAELAHYIDAIRQGGRFDLEFRVILPDGRIRVLHGMGEQVWFAPHMQPQIVGTIRDITVPERTELLGVVQDITEHKELQRKLELEAHTDPLTGCANRRYFLQLAERELARARRYSVELSMLMLDLDHFKAVNDKHGHQTGDLVLQKLVNVCLASLREEDVIGRLGGEEFAILMPETGKKKAIEAAERLCRAVAMAEVPMASASPLHFTTSIGVASLEDDDPGIDVILNRADRALYKAKHAGRNKACA